MDNHGTREILFVINPISGSNQSSDIKRDIAASCEKHGLNSHFFETTGKDDDQKIEAEISVVKPHGVVAAGGDGT
ncbi:MAG: acylglycerol kinase family protein, partial [Bacteroidales bacterium]|nr:acylglycerol kinase family protein [Bacteroidales bacterium]